MPTPRTAALCLALAVVSTLGGHAAFNWALRFVGAAVVSVAFLGEAPLATLLGIIIFGAVPAPQTFAGGALIRVGVGMTLFASAGEAPRQEW
jgi:drug/metabolite transporter (DMT)-like permease